MEVILKQDITGLGYKNDIIKVKAGYGNNYLIPNGFALIASESNKRLTTENVRQAAHKAEKLKKDAEIKQYFLIVYHKTMAPAVRGHEIKGYPLASIIKTMLPSKVRPSP